VLECRSFLSTALKESLSSDSLLELLPKVTGGPLIMPHRVVVKDIY